MALSGMRISVNHLNYIIPITLVIIALLLYLNFRSIIEVAILLGTLPLALIDSIWFMYWQGFNFSIAVGVGFIALAGVAVEIGVIMLVYLNQAYSRMQTERKDISQTITRQDIQHAVVQGAAHRVRPVLMTTSATIVGLLPIMLDDGTGSEVMQRLATPMVGGMLSALFLSLLVLPAVYYLWKVRGGVED